MAERWLSGIRGRVTSHPQIADAALGALVVGVILFAVRFGPPALYKRTLDAEDLISGFTAFLLIAARRRWPLVVYAAAVLLSAAFNLHAALAGSLLAALVICTYTVVSHTGRRIALLAGIVTVTTAYASVVIGADRGWAEAQNLAIVAWGVVAVAVGDATRSRRNNLRAVEERARQAEHSRDEEARRRVVEERLRIARDLHDVVAHHIAVINVQVGVAVHLLRTEPDGAEQALAHVRQASRTVLTELSTVLDVLRSEDGMHSNDGLHSNDGRAGIAPPPGLSRLPSLLDELATAGFRVERSLRGEARHLPSAVDLAAYRIVQESLTNAHKHGSEPTARLRLDYTASGLRIEVENATAPQVENATARVVAPADGTGHGLIGLRERVGSVGGTVRIGGADGRFTVRAFLPAPEELATEEPATEKEETPT